MHRGESDFGPWMRARPLGLWFVVSNGSGRSAPESFSGRYASWLFVAPRILCIWLMGLAEFRPARCGFGVWIRGARARPVIESASALDTVPGGCGRAPTSIAFGRRAGDVNF